MREIERDDVIEMAARTRCAVCRTPYGRHGVQLLGRRRSAWLIAVTCTNCGAEGLIVATVSEAETDMVNVDSEPVARPKIMYDVTYNEWLAFQQRPPVNQDDVLDMHMFLKDFDGDFARLFREETHSEETVK